MVDFKKLLDETPEERDARREGEWIVRLETPNQIETGAEWIMNISEEGAL